MKKINHTSTAICGTLEQLVPFDDTLYLVLSFLSWSGGQYKKIWDSTVNPLCSGFKNSTFDSFVRKHFESSDKPEAYSNCPIPAGNYTYHDFMGETSFLPEHLPGGNSEKWLIKQAIYKTLNDELLGGHLMYLNLRSNESDYMYGKK